MHLDSVHFVKICKFCGKFQYKPDILCINSEQFTSVWSFSFMPATLENESVEDS